MPDRNNLEKSLNDMKSHKEALESILHNRLKQVGALDMAEIDQLHHEIRLVSLTVTKLSSLLDC